METAKVLIEAHLSGNDFRRLEVGLTNREREIIDVFKEVVCKAEAENARLREALDEFERRTRAIPEGHEERTKGASSYNWRMSCLREIRELAALKETDQ